MLDCRLGFESTKLRGLYIHDILSTADQNTSTQIVRIKQILICASKTKWTDGGIHFPFPQIYANAASNTKHRNNQLPQHIVIRSIKLDHTPARLT